MRTRNRKNAFSWPRRRSAAQSSARSLEWIAALESRRLLAAAPDISLSDVITVPVGTSVQVPIIGDPAVGNGISYTVAGGTSAGLVTRLHDASNPWLDFYTTAGPLRFQLLADIAPNTVRQISGLVESGYYDGLDFARIVNVNGFQYVQGGAPGDGKGGPSFALDDEFNRDALFTGSGQLATANVTQGKSGKDANGSQFIVTGSAARSLDFNHTIFGQLVRGGKTLSRILNSDTLDFAPVEPVRIKQARIVENPSDAVLQVRAGDVLGETSITVVGRDAAGRESGRVITVNVVPDTDPYANTPPILEPIAPISAMPGQTIVIPIKALDLEGDDYDIAGDYVGDELEPNTRIDQLEKQIVVTLTKDAKGPIEIEVGVKGANAVSRGTIAMNGNRPDQLVSGLFDTQKITIAVGDLSLHRGVPVRNELISTPSVALDDKLLATFRASGENVPSASDFETAINWGDGTVTSDARVREVRDGLYAIYGTHAYATPGLRPITLDVIAENGASVRIETNVRVADPVVLNGRTVVITGTENADKYWIRVDDEGYVVITPGDYRWLMSEIDLIDAQLGGADDALDAAVNVLPALRVDASDGNDTIIAGPNHDTIVGGEGDDQIGGNGGNDLALAGEGNDTVSGGSGKNILHGEAGDDRITGSGGRDFIVGGEGNDRLYGRGGDDTIDAGAGVDRLYGEDGDDLLIAGSGNDRVYGGRDDDTLFGKAGNDLLNGGPGSNRRGDDDDNDVLIDL